VTLASLIGMVMVLAPARARADEPWDAGHHWVSARIGFVKSGAEFAPDGSLGYGFGYSWILGHNLAWSATAGYDLLGKYGGAAEFEIPLTTEFTRHFRWGSNARPYLGLGWGAIYHKTYRTGADESGFRQAIYLTAGGNTKVNANNLLGLDFRYQLEQDTRSNNPTFPNSAASSSVLSAKLSYSRVF
jgi:hypothetical protein